MTTSSFAPAIARVQPARPETLWVADDLITLVAGPAQTGAFTIFDARQPVGHHGPPPHIHDDCGESFYILEGTVQLTQGGEQVIAGPGDFAFVPAGVVHTFRNIGDEPSRILIMTAPGGIDDYFRLVGTPERRDPAEAVRNPRPVTQDDIDRLVAGLAQYRMRLA